MDLNISQLTPEELQEHIKRTAEMLLGNRLIYDINPLHDAYNETFISNNHGPLLLHLALNLYSQHNSMSFDDMRERMIKLLTKGIPVYPFETQDEEIFARNGVLMIRKNQGISDGQNILYKIRASYTDNWEVSPSRLLTLYNTKSEINFFTYIYSSFFKANRDLRKHIIANLPNINFPSILIESYVYIKSLTSLFPNSLSCEAQVSNYNKFLDKQSSEDFYISEPSILIDPMMDKKAKTRNAYESLLYIYLAFPICCDDNATVWETIRYNSLYQIVSSMLHESKDFKGRLSNELIISDLKKAQSILLKGSVDYSSALNGTSNKKTVEEDIVFLMGTNISNDLWEQTKDLPEDWLSLL